MIETLSLGFLAALALLIIMFKIGIVFFAKYHWQTDVAVSVGLTALFFGTFTGMIIALIAGIFISIFLAIVRLFIHIPEDDEPLIIRGQRVN
jgi:ABC-type phosphate transport system permease subunit